MIDDFRPAKPKKRVNVNPMPGPGAAAAGPHPDNGFREPVFRTPEEVAVPSSEFSNDLPEPVVPPYLQDGEQSPDGNGKPGKKSKPPKGPVKTILLFRKWRVSRKKFIIWTVVIVLLLAAAGAAAYYQLVMNKPEPVKAVVKAKKVAPPPPPPITSPLTGVIVDNKDMQRWPVMGVMIENSSAARPQSGLKDAGIVFEAIAEAGITRFLALYQESRPGNIGPIRSARPYYLDWAMAFDASYAHVGGSPDALARIKAGGIKDMDQFFNPSAYHRITQRYAPHNVYTGVQQLVDLSVSKGWDKSEFMPLERKADKLYVAPPAETPASTSNTGSSKKSSTSAKKPTETRTPANTVDLAISSSLYNVHYDFDKATNTYLRSMAGAPHKDNESGAQLSPKVVVALVMPYSLMADGKHSQYATNGSGKVYVFQDGTVTTGTWSKGEPSTQFEFKDDSGSPIKLNAGQTWFSVVGEAGKVTYQ